MTLPIDLILVRHGQSEGNAAMHRSRAGDNSAYTPEFLRRHSASFRLTERGRGQAIRSGGWIADNLGRFDRCITSEYARAMETAGLLGLPFGNWFCDFYLTERDWGDLDSCPQNERDARFGEVLARREVEPFFWSPPNGESFKDLCLRVDRVLHTLHRECSDQRVIVVCHGEVMWAFRVRIERMSQVRFRELHLSTRSQDRINNCQVLHYTRRSPEGGELERYVNWMRMLRPAEDPVENMGWRKIARPRYTNEQLLQAISSIQPMVA